MYLVVDARARLADDLVQIGEVRLPFALPAAFLDRANEERERLVEELDRLEERLGESGLERLAGVEHPVLPERVLDDEADRLLCAHEARDQLRSAPARDEPEQHLRAGEVAHVRGEGSVVAVERDLDAAAERRAVDSSECGEGQRADASEELVAGLAPLAGALGRDLAELVDVRADGEDERLAREHEPGPLAFLDAVE